GALSCADLLAFLTSKNLPFDKSGENHFILSKGHSCPALYAMAAIQKILPFSALTTLRKINSLLQGHPSVITTPWVEASTGSLGQGFSAAIGLAMGKKHLDKKGSIFTLLGDGELQEGQIWEGAMCAAHYKLDNLCAIVDYNKLQSDDNNENIMGLNSLFDKWQAFNWNIIEINGHDFNEIQDAFHLFEKTRNKPTVIIANTVKGKGVSFMENIPAWHGSVKIKKEEFELALRELGASDLEVSIFMNNEIPEVSL
ncbi:MAG: transketolase, partial [Crocinitomicaceae bacterium]|nr:transketolase [Crocinitomicaceae bacterium]